jgi:UDP-2-acetamido-2,6-beta-L-arabino-hexul-4-ose reductase
MMLKIGITGESGFIGNHLKNYLQYKKDEFEIIPFEKRFFENAEDLSKFVVQCDVIVHLAAKNRTKGNPNEIYECNVKLVKDLIAVLEKNDHKPHIIFSSSTQETKENVYGESKKKGRELLSDWADKSGAIFTGLVIPNVFGPFGEPYYNSVVATFSYQLTHELEPKIETDAQLNLIYINDLVEYIYNVIKNSNDSSEENVKHTDELWVSEILNKLKIFKELYLQNNIIPRLDSPFDIALFNTFRSYIDYSFSPVGLKLHSDDRGYLFENMRSKVGGQVFFSSTKPGITRGNHFHRRKVERFCVVEGEAVIRLRKVGTDKVVEYKVSGKEPSFVDIPIHHTHNITNTGNDNLLTLFWTNEFYDPQDSDTYFESV